MAHVKPNSELAQALNDPNVLIEIAAGPPFPKLIPQKPGEGLVIGGQYVTGQPKRFIFKKAHMTNEDYRIFDAEHGRLVCVSHHFGKNPYSSLDPLGLSNTVNAHDNKFGEWESACQVSGYAGMPGLKVRPKTVSMHGRQYVQDFGGHTTFCNIGKESRLKSMSIRHNLAVRKGQGKDPIYRILIDMYGRTMQIVDMQGELVAFVQKSLQALILNAAFGQGSEMMIDVAPGVDWTAILAIVIGTKQVGAHFIKDALGNFVVNPLQNQAVDTVTQTLGVQGATNAAGHSIDQGVHVVQQMQQLYNMFYK